MTVGFLHPGAMGARLAQLCADDTMWCGAGRSRETRARADASGMREAGSLAELVASSRVIVSVCPPSAALDVAQEVSGLGFSGIYADLNAIAPSTAERIGSLFEQYVDGGIIGPPPARAGSTRLYLSGAEAERVAELWRNTVLDARVMACRDSSAASASSAAAATTAASAASALKIAYAAWSKGSAALLLAIRRFAAAVGVEDALLEEWALSQPGLADRADRARRDNEPKAWRFVGEMHEIADAFAAVELPEGFHRAAATIYEDLAEGR